MPDKKSEFQKKLSDLRAELGPSHLLIVSKYRSLEDIQIYYDLGHRDFGENKVQELADKAESLKESCPEIRWHMIGNIQSNKINALFAIPNLYAIHSVDDLEILQKLMKAEDKLHHEVKIFLQFNTSKEAEKSGFEIYTALMEAASFAVTSKKLKLAGLMTMGTIRTENFERDASVCFQDLNVEKEKLQSEFNLKLETSMGMSQDYKIALREKSDWIRLGTMMFE